jgi:hypothetical protein
MESESAVTARKGDISDTSRAQELFTLKKMPCDATSAQVFMTFARSCREIFPLRDTHGRG